MEVFVEIICGFLRILYEKYIWTFNCTFQVKSQTIDDAIKVDISEPENRRSVRTSVKNRKYFYEDASDPEEDTEEDEDDESEENEENEENEEKTGMIKEIRETFCFVCTICTMNILALPL